MEYYDKKLCEIKNKEWLQDIYAKIFNFENKLTNQDTSIKLDCLKLKGKIIDRMDSLLK